MLEGDKRRSEEGKGFFRIGEGEREIRGGERYNDERVGLKEQTDLES